MEIIDKRVGWGGGGDEMSGGVRINSDLTMFSAFYSKGKLRIDHHSELIVHMFNKVKKSIISN